MLHIYSLSVSKKKYQATLIARSLLSLCKNFNVARYSQSVRGMNTKLGILVQLEDKGYNSESYIFGVMPLFI